MGGSPLCGAWCCAHSACPQGQPPAQGDTPHAGEDKGTPGAGSLSEPRAPSASALGRALSRPRPPWWDGPPDSSCGRTHFPGGMEARSAAAGLCPEFSTQWDLGGLGDPSHPCPPWMAVSCRQNWWGRWRASARRPARLRPFAKLNYHRHGLGDKKLKTKDFKITSFQVGENGPWLGPRSHVTNSEVWVSRNAGK